MGLNDEEADSNVETPQRSPRSCKHQDGLASNNVSVNVVRLEHLRCRSACALPALTHDAATMARNGCTRLGDAEWPQARLLPHMHPLRIEEAGPASY